MVPTRHLVRRASIVDSLPLATTVLLPLVGRGLVIRRPRVVALAERIDADRRAVRLCSRCTSATERDPCS